MLDTPTFNKISSVALWVSLILLVLSIGYLVFSLINNAPVRFDTRVAVNYVSGDIKARGDSYTYYNGNNFIQISLTDMSKQKLSDYDLLTDIASIHWMDGGAVFSFSDMPRGAELSSMVSTELDELINTYNPHSTPVVQNMYWYIDFSDGSISYLTYTDNPFGVLSDTEGNYVYFSNTIMSDSMIYLGSIDKDGSVANAIFSTTSDIPARIIGRKENTLQVVRANNDSSISLLSFDMSSSKETVIIQDIYNQSPNHSIYEDIAPVGDSLALISFNKETHEVYVEVIDSSQSRKEIYRAPESSVIDYIGGGIFTITSQGDNLSIISQLDIHGEVVDKPLTVERGQTYERVISYRNGPLLVSRPYISVQSSQYPSITSIDDTGIEKGYSSENSVIERDIYSDTNNINTYYLMVSNGSLNEELSKLKDYTQKINVDINDITIIPSLGSRAVYDLD